MLSILHTGDFFFMVGNPAETDFEYCCPGVEKVLGYDSAAFTRSVFYDSIHPDDVLTYAVFETDTACFFKSLPPEKVMKYKARLEFRLKRRDGRYIRIMQQAGAAETADDGTVIRYFTVCSEITGLKPSTDMRLSFLGLEGEPSYMDTFKGAVESKPVNLLSRREKEILSLLAQNKSSAEIADLLFISKHTVDNHRKNMLHKTGTASTLQLVVRAAERRWL